MASLDDDHRGIKRTRQACQSCRRKKSRCGGERPTCSYCARLGQECQYDGTTSEQQVTELLASMDVEALLDRISTLENKLRQVCLNDGRGARQTPNSLGVSAEISQDTSHADPSVLPLPSTIEQLQSANVYFQRCHNQPYCYFTERSFYRRLEDEALPSYLIFAVMATSARFLPTSESTPTNEELASRYARCSWSLIARQSTSANEYLQLHLVQAINLLAVIDFTNGDVRQGWLKIGLAIRFAQELRMMFEPDTLRNPTEAEESRRTFWSIYLLDRLVSCGRDRPMVFQDNDCTTQLPSSELHFRAGISEQTATLQQLSHITDEAPERLDYFALSIWLANCVGHTSRYMIQNRRNERIPPWSSESEYMRLVSRLLESETMVDECPGRTLSRAVQNQYTTGDSIDQQRLGHLLFSQMLFHLCHCLLGHPFLFRQRLKDFRRPSPPSFLYEAFNRCRKHASCILELSADAQAAGCNMETSFYGYCICIAAGVQVLYVNDPSAEIRENSHERYRHALESLAKLADRWKHIGSMITALNIAFETASAIPLAFTDPNCNNSAAALSSLDVALWWHLVDYGSLSDSQSTAKTGQLWEARSQSAADMHLHATTLPSNSVLAQGTSQSVAIPATASVTSDLDITTWESFSNTLGTMLPDQYGAGIQQTQPETSTQTNETVPQTMPVLNEDWFWPHAA